MRFPLVLLLAASSVIWVRSKPTTSDAVVFTNVNVVDVRDGHVERNLNVVIRDGHIAAVGEHAVIEPSRNVRVVNAAGKYLIPGLWDMHVHTDFVTPQWDPKIIYPLYIANGITGVRDMGGDWSALRERRDQIEKGEMLGPHLFVGGPFLVDAKADAQTIQVKSSEDARAAVDKLASEGADFIKILSKLSRESYFAIAEESKKQNLHFVGHVPLAVTASEASVAGQYSIEHLTGIALACSSQETALREQAQSATAKRDWPALLAANQQASATYDEQKAKALFDTFVKQSTWQVPTLIWTKTQSTIDAAHWAPDPRLKYVPASVQKEWDQKQIVAQTPAAILGDYKNDAAHEPELVKAMLQRGVNFMAGSDGPDPFVFPGSSLHDELELLVSAGMTPAQALQSATIHPAQFMVKLDKYGLVETDHVADLVLLDANPLDDIRNTRKIAAVVLGGKYYSRHDLDKMLSDVESSAKEK